MLIPKIVAWLYDFGDGATSTLPNPTHTYKYMAGTYTVSLTVTDELGNTYTTTQYAVVRVYDYDYNIGGQNASLTNKCYWLPVRRENGYGVSEYKDNVNPGFDWIWPPAQVGAERCYDANKKEIALVLDEKTQREYRINDPDILVDRYGVEDYLEPTEIISEVHQRAITARVGEHAAIKHTETHLYVEPADRDKKGADGHDSVVGYRTDMRVDVSLHANGEPDVAITKTVKVPIDGDIVMPEEYEARSLQQRIKFYKAGYLLKETQGQYEGIDKAARPSLRRMTEDKWQEYMNSGPLFRVSRNVNPLLELTSGKTCVRRGAYEAITGPDGREYSAIRSFNGVLGSALSRDMDDEFTLLVYWRQFAATVYPVTLWSIGDLEINLLKTGSKLRIQIRDGVSPDYTSEELSATGGSWTPITVVRKGVYLYVYNEAELLETFTMTSIENYGSEVTLLPNQGGDIFDPSILPVQINDEQLEYYLDNVRAGGNQVLPYF